MRRALAPLFGLQTADHDEAWERAEDCLRASITSEQYESYRSQGYIEVPSGLRPGRVYRVDGWRPVAVFDHGQFVGAVCIRPREALPGPDILLARKLLIEGCEEDFLRRGNWLSPAWRPTGAAPSLLLVLVLALPWLLRLSAFGGPIALTVVVLLIPSLVTAALFWRRGLR